MTPRMQATTLVVVLILSNIIVYYLTSSLVSEDMLYNDMSERFGSDIAMNAIERRSDVNFNFLKYGLQTIWITFKILAIITIMTTGLNAFQLKFSFSQVAKAAILPLFIFLLPDIAKLIWFSFINPNYEMQELNDFPQFAVSDILISLDLTSKTSFAGRLFNIVTVPSLLFCYFFAQNILTMQDKRSSLPYHASFISYFVVISALRLLQLSFTSIVSP